MREPELSTLVRIADVLDLSVDELLGVNIANKVRTVEEQFQNRIAVALKALKSEDLQRLVLMIEALASASKRSA